MKGYMNPNKILHDSAARQASIDSKALPKAATRRIKSSNELKMEYHSVGYGLHFCLHDRTYYEPCKECRRSKRKALNNLSNL